MDDPDRVVLLVTVPSSPEAHLIRGVLEAVRAEGGAG